MQSKIYYKLTLFLCLTCIFLTGQELRVISSNQNQLIFEYIPKFKKQLIESDNGRFVHLDFSHSYSFTEEAGAPDIQYRKVNIAVPSEFGNVITILDTQIEEISGVISPVPDVGFKDGKEKRVYETNNKLFMAEPDIASCEFGEYSIQRNIQIQSLKLFPVRYDHKSKKIYKYKKILVKVNFSKPDRMLDKSDESFLSGNVLNQKVSKNWNIKRFKSLNKINDSVLANGTWYKFETPKEGIYKITKDELSNMGINTSSVNPSTIKIYGNGGYRLNTNPEKTYTGDLKEIPIEEVYESGQFSHILFYGRGVDFWYFDESGQKIVRNKNYYAQNNYYWITGGGSSGKRIQNVESNSSNDFIQQRSTPAFIFDDRDSLNLMNSGLRYFSDEFSSSMNTRTYINQLPNVISDSLTNYKFAFASRSSGNRLLKLYDNNELISSHSISQPAYYGEYAIGKTIVADVNKLINFTDSRSTLQFNFNAPSGNLDYFEITYFRELIAIDNELMLFAKKTNDILSFDVSGFTQDISSVQIFDVTEHNNVFKINGQVNGTGTVFQVEGNPEIQRKFYICNKLKYLSVQNPVSINNSNIRGITNGYDLIIIAPADFEEQAERFADYKNNSAPEKVSTKVFYLNDLYNEFAYGLTDPIGIRNFIKYAFDNWNVTPKYVLLFGDGDYDYLNKENKNQNFVPAFYTLNSLSQLESYPYDDFYIRVSGNDSSSDLAIGRFCVNTNSEAESFINKIIKYENDFEPGLWKNNITLVSDDGIKPNSSFIEYYHVEQSERLSENYIPKSFGIKKIYLSLYDVVQTGFGRSKPGANEAIINAVNNGTMLLNYIGHGSPSLWADERVFVQSSTIPKLKNENHFFLTVASCDFAEFDNSNETSASEELCNMSDYGAIGVIAASRPVYSGANAALDYDIYKYLTQKPIDEFEANKSIGEAITLAKNENLSRNTNKFVLISDPSLKLKIPELRTRIDSINGRTPNNDVSIKALEEVSVTGSVLNLDNQVLNNLNGEAIISVYDSETSVHLEDVNREMKTQGGVIFRGRASLENGKFSTSFVVPKDISYENKNGRIVAYISDNDKEGIGYTDNFTVGGTANLANDNNGPEVMINFDNENDSFSYLVNPNFKLLVQLEDETGLNTTGAGIGHKMEAIIDDDLDNTIDLSSFYIGDVNAGSKSGKIEYNFTDFEPGEHSITIKAWDVFNNPTIKTENFKVVNDEELIITDIYNYPNPFASNTTFTFQHNYPDLFDLEIKIYTVTGRLIKKIEKFALSQKFAKIPWDGRDEDGDIPANGTYFYKIIFKPISDVNQKTAIGKLSIIK